MNCKNLTKKINHKLYCKIRKNHITFYDCNNCEFKEFEIKKNKQLKQRTCKLSKKEKERFSIIFSDLKKCAECGSKTGIEKHEVFYGGYRQTSIRLGMVVPLCCNHHEPFYPQSIHKDKNLDIKYKIMFQKKFEQLYSHEEFMDNFKIDYIEKYKYNSKQ